VITRPIVDPRLAKALAHPLRSHILTILNERVASPVELARDLGESLGVVTYHVRALEELDCAELVRTAQRRGATEHYFRATKRPFLSAEDWGRLPRSARRSISDVGLRLIVEDAAAAMAAETFDSRADRHLSRSPLLLDEQGWDDLTAALARVLDEASQIASASEERLRGSDARGIPTRLMLLHFEAPG
jgi:DNA-binding transcriptional ArsR family regulator